MYFYLASDGEFYNNDGECMGSYLELVVKGVEIQSDGSVIFRVVVLHSLIHGLDPEPTGWVTNSKHLFKSLTTNFKLDKINHVSTNLRNFFGFKVVSHKINYSELPFYYR